MKTSKIAIVAATMAATATLVAVAAAPALAATQANGSDGPAYLFNNDAGDFSANGSTIQWLDDISLTPVTSDPYAAFQCSADATGYRTFWTDPGRERQPTAYKAYSSLLPLNPGKTVIGPNTRPQGQLGAIAQIKANGGNYSIGFACLKDNGVNLAASGVWYFTAHITAGTGVYTFDAQSETPTNPGNPAQTGDIALEATTVAAQDGTLSLVVPSGAKATLGTASLVNGLSTSTGTLPAFTVDDQRVVSKPGWNLTASTANFVNGADSSKTIDAKQLGVKPTIATNPGGVVAGTEHVAGDATAFSGFASAPAGTGTGATSLSADLKLVAPSGTPAGTYASTMTLTLVSK
ncbi:hypothetical protein [Leifsonia aquatica]|uniref:WxL domain-containing protein n=2 Tax=Leifsonia aquatica TaxID=144185 RepID=U2R6G2_LEIAQ|nr:hypothetical protein [Leifsonia aquatica]ERK70830.1 hypothetical protein N136_02825 [Leifsonia aquatica ATCC 14665]MBB2967749.1 hypothetical protein [Leifsonia aquatica]